MPNSYFRALVFCIVLLSTVIVTPVIGVTQEKTLEAEQKVIPYPAAYNTALEGGSSYAGITNHLDTAYYSHLDYYNATSNGHLIILPKFKTYQQTTEYTCGPAAGLMVLAHFADNAHQEMELSEKMKSVPNIGTNTKNLAKFFKSLNWQVESSLDYDAAPTYADFKPFVLKHLTAGIPIMVENIDWGGHWRVIIGYEDMGTVIPDDDVLILADSYDIGDHYQDGYVTESTIKFYYMWFDSHMLPKNQKQRQWVIAQPLL